MQAQRALATLAILLTATASAQDRITLQQLLRLIEAGTPDSVVAAEVSDRGMVEVVDHDLIGLVRRAGGGRRVLDALERLRPVSGLIVRGLPGTIISLDGDRVGQLDSEGLLAIPGLSPGDHEVAAQLQDHLPQTSLVTLPANEDTYVQLALDLAHGFLTVATNDPDSEITLVGGGKRSTYRGGFSDEQLPIGPYKVHIAAPYSVEYEESVDVASGSNTELTVKLTPRPAAELIDDVVRALDGGDMDRASEATGALASIHPTHRYAALLAGNVAYRRGRIREATDHLLQALANGQDVRIAAKHRHKTGFHTDFCIGSVVLSKHKVAFQSATETDHDVAFTPGGIVKLEPSDYLHLRVVTEERKERNFDFFHPDAERVVKQSTGFVRLSGGVQEVVCNGCVLYHPLLARLLGALKAGSLPAAPPDSSARPAPTASVYALNDSAVSIPDAGRRATSGITVSEAPTGATVASIDVFFSAVHSYSGDLIVSLSADEQGVLGTAQIWRREGSGSDNPSRAITGLTTFDGLTANRTWLLHARDYASGDSGRIESWWIRVHYNFPSEPGAGPQLPSEDQQGPLPTGATSDSLPRTPQLTDPTDELARQLFVAVSEDSVELIRELLAGGANANATNDVGDTALLVALRSRASYETIETLVVAGADATRRDESGISSIDLARQQGREGVLRLLLSTIRDLPLPMFEPVTTGEPRIPNGTWSS